jgi:hypothetical protein
MQKQQNLLLAWKGSRGITYVLQLCFDAQHKCWHNAT